MDIKGALKKGIFWVYVDYAVATVFQAVGVIILSRILSPSAFGLFAIGLIITTFAENIFRVGFGQAIVQMNDDPYEFLNALWTANILTALLASTTMYFATPWICVAIFSEPDAIPVVRIMLMVFIFQGLLNPLVAVCVKRLDQRTMFLINMPNPVVRYSVAIAMAYLLDSVYALALGYVLGAMVSMLCSHMVLRHMPRIEFDFKKMRQLFSFSGWLQLNNFARWASRSLDSLTVGSLLGKEALGIYNRSYALSSMPTSPLGLLVGKIVFPFFSHIQDEVERRNVLFVHALNIFCLFSFGVLAVFYSSGASIVHIMLGDQWTEAASVVRILAMAFVIRLVVTLSSGLFRALGHPRLEFTLTIVQIVVLAACLYPLTERYGLVGAGYALLVGITASIPLLVYWLSRYAKISPVRWLPSVLLCLGSVFAVDLIMNLFDKTDINLLNAVLNISLALALFYALLLVAFLVSRRGPFASLFYFVKAYAKRSTSLPTATES